MKIYGQLLALSVFHLDVWNTSAFVAPKFQTPSFFSLQAQSSSYSYLGNTSERERDEVRDRTPSGGLQVNGSSKRETSDGAKDDRSTQRADIQFSKNIWDTLSPVTVQGGSLRTWSVDADRVQVLMKTDGRPLNANIELWHGPDNTPLKMGVYIENGDIRPFSAVVETPRGHNAIAIRNTGQLEFPMSACVEADAKKNKNSNSLGDITKRLSEKGTARTVQGGAVRTYPFSSSVSSVQIMLKTEGRPMSARIELLQGPNNIKHV